MPRHTSKICFSSILSRRLTFVCFMLISCILLLIYAQINGGIKAIEIPEDNMETNWKGKQLTELTLNKGNVNAIDQPRNVVEVNMKDATKPVSVQTNNELKTPTSFVNNSTSDKKRQQRLPKCIIIGTKKSGTGSLIFFLNEHPKIAASQYEPHYFDNRSRHFDKGLEWYRKHLAYSFPDQLTIEKSPSYFITEETPKRIYDFDKNIKLILIVKNPVTRVMSDYSHRKGDWKRSKALGKDYPFYSFDEYAINTTTKKVNENWIPIMVSRYSEHIANWYRYFNRSQIHIADGEELVKNPFPVVKEVEKFLNLKPWFEDKHFVYNSDRGFYCFKKTKCLDKTKGRPHPKVSDEVVHILQEYFRPYNEKFNKLTGKSFDWYD